MHIKDDGYILTLGFGFFLFMIVAMSVGCREKQGPPGPAGEPGGQGPTGQAGAPGVDGDNGKDGSNGINGQTGETGPSGFPGLPGANAVPCSVAEVSGGASINCNGNDVVVSDGTPGATGQTGPSGPRGVAGPSGAQGPAGPSGLPGSSVTAVRLCADSTSAFPEYGVRIGDGLYAVYWGPLNGDNASQAFLAQLTPGAYESTNGTGCTFTVNSDGSITN